MTKKIPVDKVTIVEENVWHDQPAKETNPYNVLAARGEEDIFDSSLPVVSGDQKVVTVTHVALGNGHKVNDILLFDGKAHLTTTASDVDKNTVGAFISKLTDRRKAAKKRKLKLIAMVGKYPSKAPSRVGHRNRRAQHNYRLMTFGWRALSRDVISGVQETCNRVLHGLDKWTDRVRLLKINLDEAGRELQEQINDQS